MIEAVLSQRSNLHCVFYMSLYWKARSNETKRH